jgi:FkbM family methyltransferase
MSEFLQTVNQFRKEFQISHWGSAKILLGYPVFKAAWIAEYGEGWKKDLSCSFLKLIESGKMKITVHGVGGKVSVPLSFRLWDLDSFKEVFWGNEYLAPFPFEQLSTYIDLGANTGMAALYFSTKCKLQKMILVEANPVLAEQLKELRFTVAPEIVNGFVSGLSNHELDFFLHENHRNSSLHPSDTEQAKKISVTQVPLRKILQDRKLEQVDLLKMDIEGGEYSIMEEDPSVFQKFRFLCAELHGDSAKRNGFVGKLKELGFEILQRKESISICEMLYAARK